MSKNNPNIIMGRPDLAFGNGGRYGVTQAKKFPPYVFSISGNSCLIHKIAHVDLWWWEVGTVNYSGDCLKRRNKPKMIAHTVCGLSKFLTGDRSRTCMIPNPDAILCGRCHGEVATFGKHGKATKAGITRTAAHVKLGCVVKGY